MKNINIFKVIDIDKDYYFLIGKNKGLYTLRKLDKNINNHSTNKIDFCTIILITNYKSENNDNNFSELFLTNNSYIYATKQEIYYSENILINYYTVIKYIFLDYKENNNLYDVINIDTLYET